MKLGYIHSAARGQADTVLSALAHEQRARGMTVAGLVRCRAPDPAGHPCDMDLTVLPDGPVIALAQKLGAGSRGCRMDPALLEDAVLAVERSLASAPDLLIINKFGPLECKGRGFCNVIAKAAVRGIPVLTAVNDLNFFAFHRFAGQFARELPPQLDALTAWLAAT